MISKNLYNLVLLFHISNGPILKYNSDQIANPHPPSQTSLSKKL